MRILGTILIAMVAAACSKEPAGGAPSVGATGGAPGAGAASVSEAAMEAKRLYGTVCATCHGETGRGDGAAAANLQPRPRDYTDAAWQASVGDAEIRKTILEGGLAVGKSPIMPAQPQLADKPEVLDEMVKLVRSFAAAK
jgi:mono/diheme cytochrome c family protein